jgi:hypothetical protein
MIPGKPTRTRVIPPGVAAPETGGEATLDPHLRGVAERNNVGP